MCKIETVPSQMWLEGLSEYYISVDRMMPPPGKRELEFCKAMFGCSNEHGTLWLETVDVLDARTPLRNDKLSLIPHNFHMVLEMFTYLTLLFHQPRNKLCFTKNHMGFLHISNIY